MAGLFEEADMPIEKLMERYGAANKSFQNLREKGDDFQSPALRPKKDAIDKIEAEHIKQSMSNKLMNGDGDCLEDNEVTCSEKTDSAKLKAQNTIKDLKNGVQESNGVAKKCDADVKSEAAAAAGDVKLATAENNCDSASCGNETGDKTAAAEKLDGSSNSAATQQPDSTQNSDSQTSSSKGDTKTAAASSEAAAESPVLRKAEVTSSDDSSPLFRTKSDDDDEELEVLQGGSGDAPVTSSAAGGSSSSSEAVASDGGGASSAKSDSASKVMMTQPLHNYVQCMLCVWLPKYFSPDSYIV